MESKELITFKGMVDGVRINLSEEAGIFELLDALAERIGESKAFFGDGDCKISFGGRLLSAGDRQRLEELMKKILPLCRVSFDTDAAKSVSQTDWVLAYKERGKEPEPKATEKQEQPEPGEFISVFRSNRARFYEGALKEGMTLHSDGHLVLLGSVCKGAELTAAGNIIVIGGLYGTAHAGCNGHNGSYIIAMDMRPEGLAIAQTAEEYTYSDAEDDIEASENDKKTLFDKLRKKSDIDETVSEKSDSDTISAVALLKNNKIQLDNFTIQDFTNLKNMV